jgi:hypothetical protein
MAVMITGCSVAQDAPIGTVVGFLHCYASGATLPSIFMLGASSHGIFTIKGGNQLVTAAAAIPLGHYAIKIRAIGTGAAPKESGRFVVEVKAPAQS